VPNGEQESAPRPDTASLLTLIDFIYAVIFGNCLQEAYCDVLALGANHPPLGFGQWWSLLYANETAAIRFWISAAVFYFVAMDWIVARALNTREPYRSYWRFLLDFLVAVLAYGALTLAVAGNLGATFYLALMFAGGVAWAVVALIENRASPYRGKFVAIVVTHSLGALGFWLFSRDYRGEASLTWVGLERLFLYLGVVFLVDEFLHRFLPRSNWIGPSGLPLPRKLLKKFGDFLISLIKYTRDSFRRTPG